MWEGITLFRGSVGVTVRNNELNDFLFVGIRCGADTGYVMDCHLNVLAYNFMTNPGKYVEEVTEVNHAGIYFCTHWFNPGEAPTPCPALVSPVKHSVLAGSPRVSPGRVSLRVWEQPLWGPARGLCPLGFHSGEGHTLSLVEGHTLLHVPILVLPW